ncbi:MAG: PQQ-binding-like beta-propeller repeat protein, partial [Fimbriiglobus sp.]
LLILMDFRFGSMGSVVELGPDMKERWKIVGLTTPMDAAILPDGTVAIAEQNSNRVTIRDTQGKVVGSRPIGGPNRVYGNPQQVQVLPNGNLLVGCRNVVVEFKADKDEEVMRYVRNQYDIAAARRLADGTTALLLQNGPEHCIFVDEKGKDIDRKLKTGMPYYQAHADEPAKGRLLVTEMNQVAEYDLKDGKRVWSKSVNQPRSVQRLPNGNTLIVDAGTNRLVEVAPEGDEVWSYQPTTGYNVFRAYRR